MKKYVSTPVAEAFAEVLAGANPKIVLGNFLDDWRRTPVGDRGRLVAEALPEAGPDLMHRRWAALFAGAVEYLCAQDGSPTPSWIALPAYLLDEPWFVEPARSLRAWLRTTTPSAFASRNVFVGEGALDRA